MKSKKEADVKPQLPLRTIVLAFKHTTLIAVLALFTALPSHGYSWYSGASAGSNGTVDAWGVTDGTTYTMYHIAHVWTTLTSPVKHRQAGPVYNSAQNSVRADVSLPFDSGDLGTYLVQSTNQVYCYGCLCYFINCQTQASVSVPYSASFIAQINAYPLSTAECAARHAPPGTSGYERIVKLELRDSNGVPIAIPGIQMTDGIQITPRNDLGISGGQTSNAPTDSAGRWSDWYRVCSTACPGSTGETDALQYWWANGIPLLHVNAVFYKCASINVEGH
jgi:hypothetical protein